MNHKDKMKAIKEGKSFECKYAHYFSMILEYSAQSFLGKASISLKSERKPSILVHPVSVKPEERSSFETVKREQSSSEKENFLVENFSAKHPLLHTLPAVHIAFLDVSYQARVQLWMWRIREQKLSWPYFG